MTAGKEEGSGEYRVDAPTYYGTFQDQPHYPQPVPPSQQPHYASSPPHYHGYQQVQGYPRVVEGRPASGDYREYRGDGPLPCCGLGFGWSMFILGFFFLIPWYIGAFIYCCLRHDQRERPGLLACVIIAVIFIFFGPGIAKGFNAW